MPAALVPRPWDFPAKPKTVPGGGDTTAPGDGEGDPTFPSKQPSTAPRLPNGSPPSSPTLMPPFAFPVQVMEAETPNNAPAVDGTPAEASALDTAVPDVNVIPPTPPAAHTLRGKPEELDSVDAHAGTSVLAQEATTTVS